VSCAVASFGRSTTVVTERLLEPFVLVRVTVDPSDSTVTSAFAFLCRAISCSSSFAGGLIAARRPRQWSSGWQLESKAFQRVKAVFGVDLSTSAEGTWAG
jgi:hypothetical protein